MAKVRNGGVMFKRTITAEIGGDRMADQVVACDVAAQSLSADERGTLRRTGRLPAWFYPRIDQEVAKLKNERRQQKH
jgi:hypothetical protein